MIELLGWQPTPPLQRLELPWLDTAGVELAVLRLDLIDPQISGNKWYKLRPYLQHAHDLGLEGLMSLGGSHSNHLHALAAAGQRGGFASVGLLRGEPCRTPTVEDLDAFGMSLHWLGYGGYRARHRADFWDAWQSRYPQLLPVPEGGGGLPGARGCAELVTRAEAQLPALGWDDFDAWWLACGTGTTLAGLVMGEAGARTVHGALAVPEDHGVPRRIAEVLTEAGRDDAGYQLHPAARGGFARLDRPLASFIAECQRQAAPPLEPLYTAKALLALREALEEGRIRRGTRLVFVHTGGLQGLRGLEGRLAELNG